MVKEYHTWEGVLDVNGTSKRAIIATFSSEKAREILGISEGAFIHSWKKSNNTQFQKVGVLHPNKVMILEKDLGLLGCSFSIRE